MRRAIPCACVLAATAAVADAAPKLLKGPYLQDLAPTSITVMWEMDEVIPGKLTVSFPGTTSSISHITVIDVGARSCRYGPLSILGEACATVAAASTQAHAIARLIPDAERITGFYFPAC